MNFVLLLFRHPDDVDLFVGVNHESHVPGGIVGPVSACIIGTQFQHLKYGDRFFYKHEGQFTPGSKNFLDFLFNDFLFVFQHN